MEKSSCSNLGEYINKGMNGKTISQTNEAEKSKLKFLKSEITLIPEMRLIGGINPKRATFPFMKKR